MDITTILSSVGVSAATAAWLSQALVSHRLEKDLEVFKSDLERERTADKAQVEGRMKRKMLALRKLMESGAGKVIISDGRVEHPIEDALSGKGTVIQ